MSRRKMIYEGKAKIIYEGPDPSTVIQYFKDDATAFNAEKKAEISGKGVLNNRISAHLMTKLEEKGIPTHFIRSVNMREQLVRKVEVVPIELVVRNIAAGSLVKRLGLEEGEILQRPLIEYYYKKDELGDPLVGEEHIYTFGWADPYELEEMSYSKALACASLISNWNLAVSTVNMARFTSFWLMKYRRIIAAYGMPRQARRWIKTASVLIWVIWLMDTNAWRNDWA